MGFCNFPTVRIWVERLSFFKESGCDSVDHVDRAVYAVYVKVCLSMSKYVFVCHVGHVGTCWHMLHYSVLSCAFHLHSDVITATYCDLFFLFEGCAQSLRLRFGDSRHCGRCCQQSVWWGQEPCGGLPSPCHKPPFQIRTLFGIYLVIGGYRPSIWMRIVQQDMEDNNIWTIWIVHLNGSSRASDQLSSRPQDQPSLKLMRSLKSMRALRLVRTFRFVRGLRLLVTACKCFIPSLFWSMVPWLALLSLANLGINSSEPQ